MTRVIIQSILSLICPLLAMAVVRKQTPTLNEGRYHDASVHVCIYRIKEPGKYFTAECRHFCPFQRPPFHGVHYRANQGPCNYRLHFHRHGDTSVTDRHRYIARTVLQLLLSTVIFDFHH